MILALLVIEEPTRFADRPLRYTLPPIFSSSGAEAIAILALNVDYFQMVA